MWNKLLYRKAERRFHSDNVVGMRDDHEEMQMLHGCGVLCIEGILMSVDVKKAKYLWRMERLRMAEEIECSVERCTKLKKYKHLGMMLDESGFKEQRMKELEGLINGYE